MAQADALLCLNSRRAFATIKKHFQCNVYWLKERTTRKDTGARRAMLARWLDWVLIPLLLLARLFVFQRPPAEAR